MSLPRTGLAGTTVGEVVLLADGNEVSTDYDRVDIYDAAAGVWSTATLSVARGYVGVTAAGNEVLFAGGFQGTFIHPDVVDILDVGTEQWAPPFVLSPVGACRGTVPLP